MEMGSVFKEIWFNVDLETHAMVGNVGIMQISGSGTWRSS
jgi:hypothetical protein